MKRRTLLLSGLGVGAALVVGWGLLPPRGRVGSADLLPAIDGAVALNGWIAIGVDGSVQLAMNRSEMGQGVHTALAMLAAEELQVPLASVRLVPAGADALYGNVAMFVGSLPFHPRDSEPGRESTAVRAGQWVVSKLARELGINATGGSSSVADAWEPLRLAAATARAQLLGAASLQWKQPTAELRLKDGTVSHASGASASYGALARLAAVTPPGDVKLRPRREWTLVGTPAPRIDLAAKTDGSARFGIDVREPGQVFAAVRQCPMIGGSVGRLGADAAMKLPGVERVVRVGPVGGSADGVAVVGRSTWHAQRGADALEIEWRPPPGALPDSASILQSLERTAREAAAAGGGYAFHARGDVDAANAAAARRVEAVYRAPYLAHATMEPINCTARVKDGRVDVWAPTQVPGMVRAVAARVAGLPESAVTVHVTYLGGGFGRRLEVDAAGQAVRIAMETGGRPVQLVWSREEDIRHDFYRPAAVALMRASLDDQGSVTGLRITSAGDAITPRWIERGLPSLAGPFDPPDKTASEGLFDLAYDIPHQRIAHVATTSGVPIGFWRSVGHSHNAFFSECFADELAHAAGKDPVAFRLGLLADMPRHAAVLRLAAERAGWPGYGKAATPLPAGRARGVALHESFGSIVAEVVEASIEVGAPRVHRVVCAIDCGTVVNPSIVAQQMESAVLFALSAALWGRIDIVQGVVQQRNFRDDDLRLLKLAQSPSVETHIVASTHAPAGVGEPGTPPLAPALANALFVLTGTRWRDLPLAPPAPA